MLVSVPSADRILSPRQVLLGAASGSSLENVIADTLPDGAVCFVSEQRTFYFFRKYSLEAPSGDQVVATGRGASAPGRWVQYLGGTAISALSDTFFVDVGTTVPLAEQNGSIVAPFSTIQGGLDAIPEGTAGTLLIAPGDYRGAVAAYASKSVNFIGLAGTWTGQAGSPGIPIMPFITVQASSGPITLYASQCNFFATELIVQATALQCSFFGCDVDIDDQVFGADVFYSSPGANGLITGRAKTIMARDAAILSLEVQGAASLTDVLLINNLEAESIVAESVQGGAMLATSTSIELLQCSPVGPIEFDGAPGTLTADLYTLSRIRGDAVSVINAGTIICSDARAVRTNSVATPVFAGAGVSNMSIAFVGAEPGDTFAVSLAPGGAAMPAGTALGQPFCSVAGTVLVPVIAVAAAGSVSINVMLTRFIPGTG